MSSAASPPVTTYQAGNALAIVVSPTWVLVDVEPTSDVVRQCWSLLRQERPETASIRDLLLQAGNEVGDFVFASYDGDFVRIVLRGLATVQVTTIDGEQSQLVAGEGGTPAAHVLDGRAAIVAMRSGAAADGSALPFSNGIVPAVALQVRLREVRMSVVAEPSQPATPPPAPLPPPPPSPPAVEADRPTTALPVLAVRCPVGHLTPAHGARCRVCAAEVTDRSPQEVIAPLLGQLRLSDGSTVAVDRNVVIGRAPEAPSGASEFDYRLLELPESATRVSRTHCEVRVEGWHALVVDLGSTNGTFVDGTGEGTRLEPNQPQVMKPGTTVNLGEDVTFVFEVGG